MSAALGISLWVALVTVVPGLVTIAVLATVALAGGYDVVEATEGSLLASDWVVSAMAITIMVLTQALGIVLEEVLVRGRLLGPETVDLDPDSVPEGLVRGQERELDPYREYRGLYLLLAQLADSEDAQGHLKRAIAQFFLTVNTMVAFGVGALAAAGSALWAGSRWPYPAGLAAVLILLLALSHHVARIRFCVMAKSLYAARAVRGVEEREGEALAVRVPVPATDR